MMLTVAKPFKTLLQRFPAGSKVSASTDLTPHTIESLTEAGYFEQPDEPATAPASKGKARSSSSS